MTTQTIDGVSVNTQANVYFDGKCVSHGLTLPDGTKLSVGVILPSTLTFNTGAPEIMECVGGSCEYKLDGSNEWVKSSAGEEFSIPGNSKFEIRVTEPYHYICHFGSFTHEHHPAKPAQRAKSRYRFLGRPGHVCRPAVDEAKGRPALRLHRQPGPA